MCTGKSVLEFSCGNGGFLRRIKNVAANVTRFELLDETRERLLIRNRFETKQNTQLQRYSLANHLYWLAEGKPGGHMKWTEFNEVSMNKTYEAELVKLGLADTLWYVGLKVLSMNS